MMYERRDGKLPTVRDERETLRETGQFWTPPWLAKTMAAWVTANSPPVLFDPAVGPGTFFAAARSVGFNGTFAGFELHSQVLTAFDPTNLKEADFRNVIQADFLRTPVKCQFPAIISNPPYIRHHRLSKSQKEGLRALSSQSIGFELDGRVGLHVYFLIKCLKHLSSSGRLAFLLPSDVCEGVSSRALWNRLCDRYRLEAVLTFDESAAPFPNVDTNAMVFLISHSTPAPQFKWLQVKERNTEAILHSLPGSTNGRAPSKSIDCHERDLQEGLATGFSRRPRPASLHGVRFANFARVVRGIATGANEFFFLNGEQVKSFGLDQHFFIRAIGRTRDCPYDVLRRPALEQLDEAGRPTWLLNLDDTPKDGLPATMQSYLESGEKQQIHRRALIQSRRAWYKMEQRTPPPILFAYLGRRDCRFILNEAGVVPLTGFLCVYPWDNNPEAVCRLWRALNHPHTIQNLAFAGKSYGGGAVKVEPRQLENLEIPEAVLKTVGLQFPETANQLVLLEKAS